jgi:hypothetical protein
VIRCHGFAYAYPSKAREHVVVDYRDPIPTNASKSNVSTFAEDVARSVSYEPGHPIEFVVSNLGGAISYKNPVGETKPESIRVEPSRDFTIFLPSMTSAGRDRFTIAHELGHFFLHFPLVQQVYPGQGMRATRWVDESDAKLQRCEWEANWFAASFVMPEGLFRQVYTGPASSALAAARFGVSEKAIQVRAKSLSIA